MTGIGGGDFSCFGGDGRSPLNQIPGALIRGGFWGDGTGAGAVAVAAFVNPSFSFIAGSVGFRCAR